VFKKNEDMSKINLYEERITIGKVNSFDKAIVYF